MLECGDGSIYTGYSTDITRRIAQHRRGVGARYTRGRGPLRLVYVRWFGSQTAAQRHEYTLKQLPATQKRRRTVAHAGTTVYDGTAWAEA
ncbi:MAG: GIY-YIG nuclease family protein [Haloquadratum sp.]|jgi:putative endonuclease|nr:GIY-YIG nuclease family protein [Haloferacaceae archaeon]MDR9445491.1 GIY-YIG nuclease family protein [Haloquadratum sp.]